MRQSACACRSSRLPTLKLQPNVCVKVLTKTLGRHEVRMLRRVHAAVDVRATGFELDVQFVGLRIVADRFDVGGFDGVECGHSENPFFTLPLGT